MNAFDKIIGYAAVKAEMERFCDVLKKPDKYKKLGVTMPRGILLEGEPGIGKTLMANGCDEIRITMECDSDDPTRADKSAEVLHRIFDDIDATERKIFGAIADAVTDKDGNIEVWSCDSPNISREDFMKRLSIIVINIDGSGAELYIDLDDMFTDHAYTAYMDSDGNVRAGDLVG